MKVYFSELNQAFYAADIEYPNLPNDLVEVNALQHQELLDKLNAGFKANKSEGGFTYTPVIRKETWDSIKLRRDAELARSDFTQLADWPGNKQAWAVYRQALRDLPETFSDPNDVIWPIKPE